MSSDNTCPSNGAGNTNKTMIYAILNTSRRLLAMLPDLLNNEEEATRLLNELENSSAYDLEEFEQDARRFSSTKEAFEELYPGDIDEYKQTTCEDYGRSFDSYSDVMADWLSQNCSLTCWLNDKELIVLP